MSESKYIIAPSILSANFATLGEEVVNEEEDSFDEDDLLVSTIARYHEVYCQQMLSSDLKFAKNTHFKYSNEFQSLLNAWRVSCQKGIMSVSNDTNAADLFRAIVRHRKKYYKRLLSARQSSLQVDVCYKLKRIVWKAIHR